MRIRRPMFLWVKVAIAVATVVIAILKKHTRTKAWLRMGHPRCSSARGAQIQ